MNLRQEKPQRHSASPSLQQRSRQPRSATRVETSPCAFGSHFERPRNSSPGASVSPRRKQLEASLTPRRGQAPYVIRRTINFNDSAVSEPRRSATSRQPNLVEEQAHEIEQLRQRVQDNERLIHEQNEVIEKLHRSCSDLKLEIEALISSRRSELYEELEELQESATRRRILGEFSKDRRACGETEVGGEDDDEETTAHSPMIDEFIRNEYDRSNGRAEGETFSPKDVLRRVSKDVVNLLRSLATQIFMERTRRLDLEEGHGVLKGAGTSSAKKKKSKKRVSFVDSVCTNSDSDDAETAFESMLENPEESFFQLSGPCNNLHISLARSERNVADATFVGRSYHEDANNALLRHIKELPRDPHSECKTYINYFQHNPHLTNPKPVFTSSSSSGQNTSYLIANLKTKYAL